MVTHGYSKRNANATICKEEGDKIDLALFDQSDVCNKKGFVSDLTHYLTCEVIVST